MTDTSKGIPATIIVFHTKGYRNVAVNGQVFCQKMTPEEQINEGIRTMEAGLETLHMREKERAAEKFVEPQFNEKENNPDD